MNCNLCGQNNYKIVQLAGAYEVVKCKNCRLIYVNPQPEEAVLFNNYNQDYFAPWMKEQFAAREKMWKRRLKKIQTFKKTGKLLDVGCGTGLFINEARSKGWDVYGTEISSYAVDHVKKTFGIEVFEGKLNDANFPENFFDVITFWHVLEHTTDPLGNLIGAKRVLRPDGVMVVATPNIRNYIYNFFYLLIKLKREKLFSSSDREIHLYHFSADTLKKMIEKAGFASIRFDVDKERVALGKCIIDTCAWIIYKTLRVNFGMALEVWAQKHHADN